MRTRSEPYKCSSPALIKHLYGKRNWINSCFICWMRNSHPSGHWCVCTFPHPQLLQLKWSGWYGSFLKIRGMSSTMAWHFWQMYFPRPWAFSRSWHGRHKCLSGRKSYLLNLNLNHIHVYIQCLVFSELPSCETHLSAFFTKPTSARTAWQRSQQKHSGCQLRFMAFITRPMMNSPGDTTNHTATRITPFTQDSNKWSKYW